MRASVEPSFERNAGEIHGVEVKSSKMQAACTGGFWKISDFIFSMHWDNRLMVGGACADLSTVSLIWFCALPSLLVISLRLQTSDTFIQIDSNTHTELKLAALDG